MAELALGQIVAPPGRIYASRVNGKLTWPDSSELARRDEVIEGLWRDSAEMVGLNVHRRGDICVAHQFLHHFDIFPVRFEQR